MQWPDGPDAPLPPGAGGRDGERRPGGGARQVSAGWPEDSRAGSRSARHDPRWAGIGRPAADRGKHRRQTRWLRPGPGAKGARLARKGSAPMRRSPWLTGQERISGWATQAAARQQHAGAGPRAHRWVHGHRQRVHAIGRRRHPQGWKRCRCDCVQGQDEAVSGELQGLPDEAGPAAAVLGTLRPVAGLVNGARGETRGLIPKPSSFGGVFRVEAAGQGAPRSAGRCVQAVSCLPAAALARRCSHARQARGAEPGVDR